jgi:hypothetical protein
LKNFYFFQRAIDQEWGSSKNWQYRFLASRQSSGAFTKGDHCGGGLGVPGWRETDRRHRAAGKPHEIFAPSVYHSMAERSW